MATGLSIDEQLAAATELNRARVAPQPTEDDAPKEKGAGASFRELKQRARQAAATAIKKDVVAVAKKQAAKWVLTILLSSVGTYTIFTVLGALAIFALVVSWYTDPWKLLSDIVNLGLSAISALAGIFTSLATK